MPEYILGIDGGQTSTKLLVATVDGDIVWGAEVASETGAYAHDRVSAVEGGFAHLLQEALGSGQWAKTVYQIVVLGMTGAEPGSPRIPAYRRAAERSVRARRHVVVHDAVTNLLGASAGQPGIVVIAGGGAVAHGLTADGHTWTSGGWGYIIGDEGSGYNVGRAAINAVFRALDKRTGPTRLTGHILQRFGACTPVELKYAIFEGQVSFQDIANWLNQPSR